MAPRLRSEHSRQSSLTSEKPSLDKTAHLPRLLLVEDDALIAMSEQMELERYGYQVVVAGTGEDALELCNSTPAIDLILMDVDLGAGMSGPETATQILKIHQVPVLFLSCHTEPEVVAQTERISSYGYVVKNSGITVLDASIKMALKLFQSHINLASEKARSQLAEKRLAAEVQNINSLSKLLQHSSQAFAIAYRDGRIGQFNAAFEQLTGYTAAELASVDWIATLTPPEWNELEREKLDELDRTLQSVRYEKEYRRKDGSRISIELVVDLSMDAEGRPEYYYGFVTDITERKREEEKIKTLLEEKKLILEDVHHRIKNNMFAITNLLTIQASTVSEAAGRENLLEAAGRVQCMVQLYDNLLQSSDYLSVRARSFLSSLADAVVASFSGSFSVAVEKSIDDCLLSVGQTHPLGLILNELLTNAMKHAFVGRSSGKVTVTFRSSEGRGVLAVQDDGAGMPGSINFENSHSLGLKLIHLLAKQMGGTVGIERGKGTKTIVEFPIAP